MDTMVKLGIPYRVKNHDGQWIVKGFTRLLGSPAVNVKKKTKSDFRVFKIEDLIPIEKVK